VAVDKKKTQSRTAYKQQRYEAASCFHVKDNPVDKISA
jgi:hypothetical protein